MRRWAWREVNGFAARRSRPLHDVPFEFVGEVASAGAMAEASHVESGTTARHLAMDVLGVARLRRG